MLVTKVKMNIYESTTSFYFSTLENLGASQRFFSPLDSSIYFALELAQKGNILIVRYCIHPLHSYKMSLIITVPTVPQFFFMTKGTKVSQLEKLRAKFGEVSQHDVTAPRAIWASCAITLQINHSLL